MVTDTYSVNVLDAKFVALHIDSILKIDEYNISIVNQEGIVKQDLTFPKSEGGISGYHKNAKMMVCYTNKCYVRLIDISKREIKVTGNTKHIDELLNIQDASILELKISNDSTKALMIMNYPKVSGLDKYMIVVWNIENDVIVKYGLNEEPTSVAWEVSDSR